MRAGVSLGCQSRVENVLFVLESVVVASRLSLSGLLIMNSVFTSLGFVCAAACLQTGQQKTRQETQSEERKALGEVGEFN